MEVGLAGGVGALASEDVALVGVGALASEDGALVGVGGAMDRGA